MSNLLKKKARRKRYLKMKNIKDNNIAKPIARNMSLTQGLADRLYLGHIRSRR